MRSHLLVSLLFPFPLPLSLLFVPRFARSLRTEVVIRSSLEETSWAWTRLIGRQRLGSSGRVPFRRAGCAGAREAKELIEKHAFLMLARESECESGRRAWKGREWIWVVIGGSIEGLEAVFVFFGYIYLQPFLLV